MATKNKKTSDARERARQAHEQQLKKEKRNARITMWTIIGVIVVLIALIVGFFIMNSNQEIPEEGQAPAVGNEHGGITMVSSNEVVEANDGNQEINVEEVGDPADGPATEVAGGETAEDGEPVQVIIYADANCVHCASFEQENVGFIAEQLDAGNITAEYRLVNYLDNPATQNYSSRAANAMVCAAQNEPENFMEFQNQIFGAYDVQQGRGMSNDDIISMANDLGMNIDSCIKDNHYRTFVNWTSAQAMEDGIMGTPSIWVNGSESGANSFQQDVLAAIDE